MWNAYLTIWHGTGIVVPAMAARGLAYHILGCTPCRVNGPLTSYVKLRVAHASEMPGTFFQPSRVSDPDMHHDASVTHVSWCMPGSLTSGFLWIRWREKRCRNPRRMRDSQFYVSGKRPMQNTPQQRLSLFFYIFFISNIFMQGITNQLQTVLPWSPVLKNRSIFTICMQNNSFHIIMIYTVIW